MRRVPGVRRAAKIPSTESASSNPTPLAASWLKHHLPLRDDRARDYRRTKKSPAQLAGLQFLRHHFDDRVVRCQLVRSAYFRIQVNPRSAAARRVITSI